MVETKSCRDCAHDNPDDYKNYCKPCITNNRINWEEQKAEQVRAFITKKNAETAGQT